MAPRRHNPFREMDDNTGEAHPLDLVARSRMPEGLENDIRVASKKLLAALGNQQQPWLDLEALLNEQRQAYGEILYNLGFEHGFTAGNAEAFSRLRSEPNVGEYLTLSSSLRKKALLSQLSPGLRVAALLEAAWALAFQWDEQG